MRPESNEAFHCEISLQDTLKEYLVRQFPTHPFAVGVTKANARPLLENYLAMSQAFPFLQAGAQRDLIFNCIERNQDVTEEMEQTSVVGSFLCWDETGGNYLLQRKGMKGLPEILQTGTHFHANLLKKDLKKIFGENVKPHYGRETANYLYCLYEGLSCIDSVVRCAAMVAFEAHAERMINSLWESLVDLYDLKKEDLTYFAVHTGGDDPAEAYHVAMTSGLVRSLVPGWKWSQFFGYLKNYYGQNIDWCRSLTQ